MSLKNILTGLGRRILGGKKESATPATGQQQRQITYEPKPSQAQGQELATREIRNPPVVLKKTKPLQMGDDIAPAFGSSTYDWAMRIGRSKYSADEWLNHLTSTRKVNFKIFGKPATKTVREPKRFKYDSGPFAGKEVNVSREELFDSNLAIFNDAGDLTGGLLYAAKKFGLKLDANEVGAMLKLNPINRLQAIELGVQKGAQEKFEVALKGMTDSINKLKQKFSADTDLVSIFDDALYQMEGMKNAQVGKSAFNTLRDTLRKAKARPDVREQDKALLNKAEAELNIAAAPLRNNKTKYQTETSYTLQGGKDYRETIFHLPEDIVTNTQLRDKGGHFSDILPNTNNIYHIRYDTRFTPEGKKVFMINEIQSDVNQSISKALQKNQQLSGEFRTNPFNADVELNLLINRRGKLMNDLNEAIDVQDFGRVNAIKSTLDNVNKKLTKMTSVRSGEMRDYFPMVESDAYADHAIKYLSQKAARENVDFIAVAPFDKLSFRQGYKAGNERFYGYANGKGIGKRGKAILPDVMSRLARFYNTKAGPTKISLSDPSKPYKQTGTNTFKYPTDHPLKGKEIKSKYHMDAFAKQDAGGTKPFIDANDPRLYFDAFAIKVTPMMRQTQKTYKSQGGLVVDIFNTMRYN
tara:strand:- start:554 stop:2467 length:1914 start_codon:yes stop_codon:yes gene_type:complete